MYYYMLRSIVIVNLPFLGMSPESELSRTDNQSHAVSYQKMFFHVENVR